jgi:hypothetical protein
MLYLLLAAFIWSFPSINSSSMLSLDDETICPTRIESPCGGGSDSRDQMELPFIRVLPSFLNDDEIAHFRYNLSTRLLSQHHSPYSSSMYLSTNDDIHHDIIQRRLLHRVRACLYHSDPLVSQLNGFEHWVLPRYINDQRYDWHLDSGFATHQIGVVLKREVTFLVYLNDIPHGLGGETIFGRIQHNRMDGICTRMVTPTGLPLLPLRRMNDACNDDRNEDQAQLLRIRPEAGKALLFRNHHWNSTTHRYNNNVNPYSIHGSCPLRHHHNDNNKNNDDTLPGMMNHCDDIVSNNDNVNKCPLNNDNSLEKWIIQMWIHHDSDAHVWPL